jgi:hypothetical protein
MRARCSATCSRFRNLRHRRCRGSASFFVELRPFDTAQGSARAVVERQGLIAYTVAVAQDELAGRGPGVALNSPAKRKEQSMETSTAIVLAVVQMIALWIPYYIWYARRGKAMDTPGSHGGSRVVTPTLARTSAACDRLDRAQTMRAGRITTRTLRALMLCLPETAFLSWTAPSQRREDVRRRG